MIEKITLEPNESDFNGVEFHNDCLIDTSKELTKPPIAISYGYDYNSEHTPLVTYGNFACLVGSSKSYKSFLKSALVAGYIGAGAQTYFSNVLGHDTRDKYIIDIDTEQSNYHVQRTARRVEKMTGIKNQLYKAFAIRPKTPEERVQFIDWLFYESQYKGKIGLMAIDGAADLVNNVNDLEKCNDITSKFMKWTAENNCAILTVIHKNYDSNKPTGHLGSSILKKAETVIFIDREDTIAKVKPTYTRNIPFDEFTFRINEEGLPTENNNIF